jgi:uncharacterized protein YndB with AHSA1/START domain
MNKATDIDPTLDLVLERVVDVPVQRVWAAWTDPTQIVKWFTPAPWKTTEARVDLRVGGEFFTLMESPEGERFPNAGCYLEIVPGHKLVWTDALLPGFRPSAAPFMTATLLLAPAGTGTRYTAIAHHSDAANRAKHEEMGFVNGWGTALDQLVAFVKST